ncbi:hypothetical protein F5X99DRAFT_356717 [Biscogniauxia marginata]|nr:hypothetical protein F5X99DRAFT_356717 [Biscogniauxia marginata]
MGDPIASETETHPRLPPRAVSLNNSPSKLAGALIDFSQVRNASTSPPSPAPSPPSSLWPEPVHTPRITHEAIPNAGGNAYALPEPPADDAPNLPVETKTRDMWENTSYRNSTIASCLARAQVRSGPRIDSRSHYPDVSSQKLPLKNWRAYPQREAPEIETYDLATATCYGIPPDPFPQYLKQSHALQQWMCQKIKEIIHSRNGMGLHAHERSAVGGITPASLEDDSLDKLVAKLKIIVRGGESISEYESNLIREILDRYTAFVDIKSYESWHSTERYLSGFAHHRPKQALSKVERLLGSDGSMPCKPDVLDMPTHSKSCFLDAPTRYSVDEAAATGLGNSVVPPKKRMVDKPVEVLIPDWFPVLEAQKKIKLVGKTPAARLQDLLNYIWALEVKVKQLKYQEEHPSEEGVAKNHKWDQVWHNPNPNWRHETQRKSGGWWKCRSDPDAPKVEQKCEACRGSEKPREDFKQRPPQQMLDEHMNMIMEAMREVANADKAEVLARMGKRKDESDVLPQM